MNRRSAGRTRGPPLLTAKNGTEPKSRPSDERQPTGTQLVLQSPSLTDVTCRGQLVTSRPRHGTARHGTARHGTVRHGVVLYGMVRHGTAVLRRRIQTTLSRHRGVFDRDQSQPRAVSSVSVIASVSEWQYSQVVCGGNRSETRQVVGRSAAACRATDKDALPTTTGAEVASIQAGPDRPLPVQRRQR